MISLSVQDLLIFFVLPIFLVYQYVKSSRNLPPGPFGYPIVGNAFQMGSKGHLKMAQWAEKYGKIYQMRMGSLNAIVVNDLELIKEMLGDSNFSIRAPSPIVELFTGGKYGIISTNGRVWEEQRKWSLRKLRDFGFGKTSMEGLIMEEVNEALETLKNSKEEYIFVKEILDLAVINALWTLLNGERLSQSDPKIRQVLNTFHQIIPTIMKSGLGFLPWLKYLIPSAQKSIEDAADAVMKFCRDAVAHHYSTYEEGESRDFIDEYMHEIEKTKDPHSSFFGSTGRKNLEATVSDFLQAGSETTSNTIMWLLIFLSDNPNAQKKLHKELDSVLGKSRQVSLSDRLRLPFLEAVIMETLRHSSLLAGGFQHSALTDKQVGGYTIPKGSWIMPNLYFIHHDPKIWGDPDTFRPERFLSSDKSKVVRHPALIPFQIGKRQCLGESLAKDTLFLFCGNIIQKFTVKRLETEEPESNSGLFRVPKDYHFSFTSRHTD